MRTAAVLIGAASTLTVAGALSWKVGYWLGDLTYDRWIKRRLNGRP